MATPGAPAGYPLEDRRLKPLGLVLSIGGFVLIGAALDRFEQPAPVVADHRAEFEARFVARNIARQH